MGWLSGWLHRKPVTITGQGGAGTDYQVILSIGDSAGGDFHLEGNCTNFPQDIAVTDNDGTTLLDHWVEDLTSDPIKLWVEVADSLESDVDVYIYYDKTGESSASNITNTFLFGDDCSGSVVSDKYDTAGGVNTDSFSYSGGEMITDYDVVAGCKLLPIKDTYSIPNNVILECDLKVESGASSEYVGILMRWTDSSNHYQMYSHDGGNSYILDAFDDAYTEVATGITGNTWYESKGVVYGDSLEWYPMGSLLVNRTDATHTTGRVGLFGCRGITHWDNIRARKYNSPEPAYSSAGSEENALAAYTYGSRGVYPILF